ncbi:MAG: hypothetical protein OEV21_07870 [Thermoplasmata archaeon]|nr:hypothetical protein [Thermoplasmata archaeon]
MDGDDINQDRFEEFLKERFLADTEKTEEHRIIDAIEDLISKHQTSSIASFLLDAAMMISRTFEFKEVAIGLKDNRDALYKYAVTYGFMPATQEALKKITYTSEDMVDHVKFPDVKIGRHTEFVMTASLEVEQKAYNRPGFLKKTRQSMDEFLEGDYIDIYMYGGKEELIGWLELAGPKNGKIPGKDTIVRLELLSSIIARVVWERIYCYDAMKKSPVNIS